MVVLLEETLYSLDSIVDSRFSSIPKRSRVFLCEHNEQILATVGNVFHLDKFMIYICIYLYEVCCKGETM